jgi:chloramphenicol-sensitive protein RarD
VNQGSNAFIEGSWMTMILLALVGVVTAVPLLLFASAAHSIPLYMIGILQYIAPTCQFLLGVLVFHEPFTPVRMVGFSLIWAALALYSFEGYLYRRRRDALEPA